MANSSFSRGAVTLLAASLLTLSACGGGSGASGGGPTTNPPPPPPPPDPKSFDEMEEDFTFLASIGVAMTMFPYVGAGFSNINISDVKKHEVESVLTYGQKSGKFELSNHYSLDQGGALLISESFTQADLVADRSNNVFAVYKTSDAEFALLNPGPDGSGYDYTALILVVDNNIGNTLLSGDVGFQAAAFGFPTVPDTLPATGQAEFRGGIVGNVTLETGDSGVLNGPALLNVDFETNEIIGLFGGITSSDVLENLQYASFLGGESRTFPDIRFTAPLNRTTGLFEADIRFSYTNPLVLDPRLLSNPGGRVTGGFFGPAGENGPPEVGGTLQVKNELLTINAAFAARQGGEASGFNFAGLRPQSYNFDSIRPYPVEGSAPDFVPDGFVEDFITIKNSFPRYWENRTYPSLPAEFHFINSLYDYNSLYRKDLSGSNALTFDGMSEDIVMRTHFYRVTLDTQDANRFNLEEIRFGFSALSLQGTSFLKSIDGPYSTTFPVMVDYFVFGNIAQPKDLPLTGLAHFEGGAFGQYYIFSPLENGPALEQQYFDFRAKTAIDLNFATGLTTVTFSDYVIPEELLGYVAESERESFFLTSGFHGSLNFFDEVLINETREYYRAFKGHIFQTAGGELEIGGRFHYYFGRYTPSSSELRITGAFGGSLVSLTDTGEAPRMPSGVAVDLIDSLLAATDDLTRQDIDQFTHLMNFLPANPGQVEGILSSYKTYNFIGGGGSFGLDTYIENNRKKANVSRKDSQIFLDFESSNATASVIENVVQGHTAIAERITLTEEILKNAPGNAIFTVISEKTATGGDEILALSRPGSDVFGLDYAGFGIWALEEPSRTMMTNAFVYGAPTPETDMPSTGTANYAGAVIGTATQGNLLASRGKNITVGTVMGDSSLDVDFGASTVELTLDNLQLSLSNEPQTQTMSLPPITGTGQISASSFGGKFDGNTGYLLDFVGTFFGPASPLPPETAGVWTQTVRDPRNAENYIDLNGVFTGKLQ